MIVQSVPVAPPPVVAKAPPVPKDPEVKDTPYQRLKKSQAGQFVTQHPVLAGAAVVGSSIVVAGGANQSATFSKVAQYGIVPLAGAGVATLGALIVQDAFVNDLHDHKLRAGYKITGGTVAALGGTQVVGDTFHIPVLDRALTYPLEKIADNGQAVLGLGVAGGGVAAGVFAANRFKSAFEKKEHRPGNIALGVVSSAASASGVLGGAELIGRQFHIAGMDHIFTSTIEALSRGGLGSVAGGGLLVAGAGVLGDEAVQNFRQGGNDLLTAAESMGAVTATLGGVELAGHGLGIQATAGLLTHHVDAVGGMALIAGGAALTRTSVNHLQANGLTVLNSGGLTLGATFIPVGLGVEAEAFGLHHAADYLFRGGGLAAGVGLAVTTAALGRKAVTNLKSGEVANATMCGVAAAGTAVGSLYTVGDSLKIPAITRLADQVAEHTLTPFFDHVLRPAGQFLFDHPVAGGVILVAGVGAAAYIYHRSKHHA